MIVPISSAVDEEVYRAVLSICGQEAADKLLYTDAEEVQEIKNVIETILNGVAMGGKR